MPRLSKEEQKKRFQEKKAARANKVNTTNEKETSVIDNPNSDEYQGMGLGTETTKPSKNSTPGVIVDPFLQGKTTEKSYARDNVTVIGSIPNSVPEDYIERPVIDLRGGTNQEPKFEPGEVKNPAWEDMSKKQQTQGSEYVAENIISGYVALNTLAKDFVSFNEDKFMRKALKGEFDMEALDIELPISENGQTVPVRKLLEDVNEMADRAYTVSDKFKEEVRPLLVSICKEKGLGMSPGQQLAFIVGKDALPKIMNMFQIKKAMDYFLTVSLQVLGQYREYSHNQRNSTIPPQGTTITNPSTENNQPSTNNINETKEQQTDSNEVIDGSDYSDNLSKEKDIAQAGGKKTKKDKKPKNTVDVISESKEPGEEK